MNYNAHMANCWKIYTPEEEQKKIKEGGVADPDWGVEEDAELEKLARRATATARQSLRQINAAKAAACRKQLLQEMKEAR